MTTFFFNGRLGMPISDKWSGFYLGRPRDFKVLRSQGSMCTFLMFLKECLGSSSGERGCRGCVWGGRPVGGREDCTSPNVRWEQEALKKNDVSVFSLGDSVDHSSLPRHTKEKEQVLSTLSLRQLCDI